MQIGEQIYDVKYVANYLRKSRGDEDKDLAKHRMVLTELCQKNNYKFVEYVEIGTSDSIDMRPKMQQLLNDVEEGIYDAVCVVEYDRLSRGDLGEQDKVKKAFQKSETLIITPEKIYNLNNDLDDTYTDFKGLLARQEYKMITKRLQQGKKIGARRGDWTNGIPPYPYEYQRYKNKYNDKGLVINDEKLVIYKRIIHDALTGIPPKQIAYNLNKEDIPSPRAKHWNNVGIYRLLKDETHLGKIISNKSQGEAHKVKKQNAKPYKKKPKSDWVIVENCHEPVITQEDHDVLVETLRRREVLPRRTRAETYSLSGLIKCGICGHNMTFLNQNSSHNALMKPCWYSDAYGNKCVNRGITYKKLEDGIIEYIKLYKEDILNNQSPDEYTDIEYINIQLKHHESLLDKYSKAIDKLNDSYELGDYNREDWLKRKKRWEDEIIKSKDEMIRLNKLLKNKETVKKEDIIKRINYVLENLETCLNPSERNRYFKSIIENVVWIRTDKSNTGIEELPIKVNFY